MATEEKEALPKLYGATQLAEELGWDRRKVHIYLERGILIEPATYIGKSPVWTESQVNQLKIKYSYD